MDGARLCTECGGSLEGKRPQAKTCSQRCRRLRSKRQRDDNAAGRLNEENIGEVTKDVLRDELRPIVREAITDSVIRSIEDLIGHVPKAIEVAAKLLDSEDEKTRFDAATLILRHTTGNKSVVPDVNAGQGTKLEVVLGLPRPEASVEGVIEGEVISEKECDSCHNTKPLTEFVGGSDRCQTCYDKMQGLIKQLDDGTSSSPIPTEPSTAAVSP